MHTEGVNYDNLTNKQLLNLTKNNDIQARNHLVMKNKNLVHYTIKHHNYTHGEYEDMYQDGLVGLIHGIQDYSEHNGSHALSTHVMFHIRAAIIKTLSDNYSVSTTLNAISQHNLIQEAKSKLRQTYHQKVTPNDIKKKLNISAKRQADVHKSTFDIIPFYNPAYDKIGHNYYRKGNVNKFISNLTHHQRRIEERLETKITIDNLMQSKALNVREKRIIRDIFGLDGCTPLTLQEVGDHLNITRSRVRQIQANALSKLRHPAYSKLIK